VEAAADSVGVGALDASAVADGVASGDGEGVAAGADGVVVGSAHAARINAALANTTRVRTGRDRVMRRLRPPRR
jgi:hypothetical protein